MARKDKKEIEARDKTRVRDGWKAARQAARKNKDKRRQFEQGGK